MTLQIADARAPHKGVETLSFTTYQQCRQHSEINFQRLKTLRQIAQKCDLNTAYLCRLFLRYDHQSPYQYLLRLKMNQAAALPSTRRAGQTCDCPNRFPRPGPILADIQEGIRPLA